MFVRSIILAVVLALLPGCGANIDCIAGAKRWKAWVSSRNPSHDEVSAACQAADSGGSSTAPTMSSLPEPEPIGDHPGGAPTTSDSPGNPRAPAESEPGKQPMCPQENESGLVSR